MRTTAATRPIAAALLLFLGLLAIASFYPAEEDVAIMPRSVGNDMIERHHPTYNNYYHHHRVGGGGEYYDDDRTTAADKSENETKSWWSSSHRERAHRSSREELRRPQFVVATQRRRRRLQKLEDMNIMDDETKRRHSKNFLGGLYPPVDKDMLPLYLRDTSDAGTDLSNKLDLIYLWHIPKASGSTMKNIMNYCIGLRRAERVKDKASMEYARDNILNMDTSSPEGLSFSYQKQIVNSNKVDVIVSNYFLSGAALFNDLHYGRTFAILRHPVDVALRLFHYRKMATWERSYRKEWNKITFREYVDSDNYIDNWMVRQLTGAMPWATLSTTHFDRAKLIMTRKIFVGVAEEMNETMRQLKAHFQWVEKKPQCAYKFINAKPTNANGHPQLQGGKGGSTWHAIIAKDKWDMSLYHYGLEMFAQQRKRYPP